MRLMRMPNVRIDTRPALRDFVRMGPLSDTERKILFVLAICVFLWVAGGYVEQLFNLPATLLSSAIVSIAAIAFLSISEIVDWNDLKGVNWGVFLVIGAGFTLGDALQKTGASAWFASMLAPTLAGMPFVAILFAVIMVSFTITQFMNNVALGAILTPVLVTVGQASGIVPLQLVIPTVLAMGLAYMLPSASARMTLVAVSGAVERKDQLLTGLLIGVPSALLIVIFFYVLSVFGMI